MKFEQRFIKMIDEGLKTTTICKKSYSLGIVELEDEQGNPTGIKIEITACQKVKRTDFLSFFKT